MSVKDDLIAAKSVIVDPKDWGKGDVSDAPLPPCYCVYTACGKVVGQSNDMNRYSAVIAALDAALPEGWLVYDPDLAAAEFNDAPATTHADIMALFDRAIASA